MQQQKNMTYRLGFLDMIATDSLYLAQIALIFSQEILEFDVDQKRKMYFFYNSGHRKKICSYVEWYTLCY